MSTPPVKPTDTIVLRALGLFEMARRLGADPDHVYFVTNEEVGTGMLVGLKILQLVEEPGERHDELMTLWHEGAVWWNTNTDTGEQFAVFKDFLEYVRSTNPGFVLELRKAIESCPRGDA